MSLLGLTQGKNVMQQIYEALNEERCILVLGPNLATMPLGDTKVPIHQQSSIELSKFLNQSGISFDQNKNDQLDYIALRCVKSNLPQIGHSQLLSLLQQAYSKQAHQVPGIYTELAKIPFHFILNASSDNYMAQALGEKAQLRYLNYHRNDLSHINSRRPIGDFSAEAPLVYNLFGLFEDKESLVISKLDQLEFINKLFNRTIEIPNSVLNQFRPDSLYLFLGFDSKSWHLPILFRILGFHEHRAAFFYEEGSIEKALEDLYTDVFKFQFRNDSILEFIKKLWNGYHDWQTHRPNTTLEEENSVYVSSPLNGLSQSTTAQVLMMTANPKNTQALNLNKEINQIGAEQERSKYRNRFRIEKELDVSKGNISFILRKNAPQILHFSGHGTGKGLLFYGENELSDQVSGEKLGKIIRNHYSISCVFLNACYSKDQATAIAQYVPNVIGTTKAISDKQATSFAAYFYRHIFAGLTYEEAYRQALDDLSLDNFRPEDFVFYKQGQLVVIS